VVIGGTFSSTALTLILLPTLYVWLEGRAQKLGVGVHESVGAHVFSEE